MPTIDGQKYANLATQIARKFPRAESYPFDIAFGIWDKTLAQGDQLIRFWAANYQSVTPSHITYAEQIRDIASRIQRSYNAFHDTWFEPLNQARTTGTLTQAGAFKDSIEAAYLDFAAAANQMTALEEIKPQWLATLDGLWTTAGEVLALIDKLLKLLGVVGDAILHPMTLLKWALAGLGILGALGVGFYAIRRRWERRPTLRGAPRAPKDPAGMLASEINRELDALEKKSSQLMDEFITQGRGSEKPSETWKLDDPLARRYKALSARQGALRREVDRRYGPGAPRRLPRGFGPIRRLGAVHG